ncbi:hypothetical protein M0R45_031483 [Rubus argutus]|uniref:Uncharacterized protein n=1 Tax=Rubus argutus TaxID=59490 RepID=A0AAW1WEM0_RUBAR
MVKPKTRTRFLLPAPPSPPRRRSTQSSARILAQQPHLVSRCLQLHSRITTCSGHLPHALYGYLSPSLLTQTSTTLSFSSSFFLPQINLSQPPFPSALLLLAPAQAIPSQITIPYGPLLLQQQLATRPQL